MLALGQKKKIFLAAALLLTFVANFASARERPVRMFKGLKNRGGSRHRQVRQKLFGAAVEPALAQNQQGRAINNFPQRLRNRRSNLKKAISRTVARHASRDEAGKVKQPARRVGRNRTGRVPRSAKSVFDAVKLARGSFDAKKLAKGSFDARKLVAPATRPHTQAKAKIALATHTISGGSAAAQVVSVRYGFPRRRSPGLRRQAHSGLRTRHDSGFRTRHEGTKDDDGDHHRLKKHRLSARLHLDRRRHRLHHNRRLHHNPTYNFRRSRFRVGTRHARRFFRFIVSPRHRHFVRYRRGPRYHFGYVYPYYHRRYVFVSLSGYWPSHYRHRRYYWYGYHPYHWYGCTLLTYCIDGRVRSCAYEKLDELKPGSTVSGVIVPDYDGLIAAREKLEEEAAQEPAEQTQTDVYFDEAVKAFAERAYRKAVLNLARAVEAEPDDVVMPFAYAQALFANGEYSEAAAVLREVIAGMAADEEAVFYPRGLYEDEAVLTEQIEQLARAAEAEPENAELQLLLGYQLLGVGRLDEAAEPLRKAQQDYLNEEAAKKLLGLLEKLQAAG